MRLRKGVYRVKMTDITKKQFILSSNKITHTGMREHRVFGVYLYTDSRLNVEEYTCQGGKKVLIIGNAFCMDKAVKSIKDDIIVWDGNDSISLTRYWTGRWVLITENELVTDASGLMALFYNINGSEWYVSSSLALLSSIIDAKINKSVKNFRIGWHIVPGTFADGINQLICTQKLVFDSHTLLAIPSIWINNFSKLSTEEKCEKLAALLINGVKNIYMHSGREIVHALTGGKDSRLVLAALLRAGIPFSVYTAEHDNISTADRTIPRKISRDFRIRYQYIKRKRLSKRLAADYKDFTAGSIFEEDAKFYACKQFAQLPQNSIIIRSGLFEAGQVFGRQIAGANEESFVFGITQYYSELKTNISQKKAFQDWLDYVHKTPIEYLDIRDRFYIEQRVGGWVAAIEQSLDMNDFISIQIANCAELLSILLSCNEEERRKFLLSYETIRMLEPKLLEYPINKRTILDLINYWKKILRNPIMKYQNFRNKCNRG